GAAAGRGGVDLVAGRRYRDHEYHAGVSDGADARDRDTDGDRSAAAAYPAAIPGRIGAAEHPRRTRGGGIGDRGVEGAVDAGELADANLAGGGGGRVFVCRGGGGVLRMVSGAQGVAIGSD